MYLLQDDGYSGILATERRLKVVERVGVRQYCDLKRALPLCSMENALSHYQLINKLGHDLAKIKCFKILLTSVSKFSAYLSR